MSEQYDVAVVGSGFAGSLTAMIAHQLGLRVVLLERGRHPRVTIGESSTPLSNLLLEELARHYDLPALRPLSKWGSWQQSHPELACGLKRGFSFFHHAANSGAKIERENQLLVEASPHDAIGDTHWYRADFDEFLVQEVQRIGVEYWDEVELREFEEDDGGVVLRGTHSGDDVEIASCFVVDATGPRGFLHRALGLGERLLPGLPPTQTLYSHFRGTRRLDEMGATALDGTPPYPVDDAAVHHLIDGGWVWVLRFNNGVTSAGVAATDALADELRLAEGEAAWERVLARMPIVRAQFADAEAVQPFRRLPRLSFRSAAISGRRWVLLPSAAGFVDPLLSTGFPLTLLGVVRLGEIIERNWGSEGFPVRLAEYAAKTDAELQATARLIGALYANLNIFPVFSALTLLYFAAASYAETARRLGKPELAQSYLLYDHPQFGAACARILGRAHSVGPGKESDDLIEDVMRAIEPIDLAGLSNRKRRNWYPVEAQDLLHAAHKVHADRDEITGMLERCGFTPATLPA
ncbi:MAG TPA: FAD-dependent oxidoreductase [Acidobacteriaceae bacterium]|nr:FAD-dependent oxidoreductase [Acidobacteriaceae bacterium]